MLDLRNITLLITSYNSLSQAIYCYLIDRDFNIDIVYANDVHILDDLKYFSPDIILSPFLKTYLPKEIYDNYPTFIFHPAPIGDRGAYSLDYAIFNDSKTWGSVWIKANKTYDGGHIYAQSNFPIKKTSKASLYRNEITISAINSLDELFINIKNNTPTPQILNDIHKPFTQNDRLINWDEDNTDLIIKKINCSDSYPGVLDEILDVPCYLYGVHKEDNIKGELKQILAKRDGAICLGTIDGAIWVSHLKEINSFKLPATYVLKDRLKGVKENRIPLIFDKSYNTFYEISISSKDNVIYLSFDFYNGAMNTAQCIRLKYAIEYLKTQCDILVLKGGEDFFSNGIDLNTLEDSNKKGEDGWANINAMNDLISSIIYADEIITIASFESNAGGGGVFIGLACDYVIGRENVVLNPHYKILNLSGSEYHTWSLFKRVDKDIAQNLLDELLPISIYKAHKLGLVDNIFPSQDYHNSLHNFAKTLHNDEFIYNKQDYLEINKSNIEDKKEKEIQIMYDEFWNKDSSFQTSRHNFVYKINNNNTPKRLKFKDKPCMNIA